MITGTTFSRVSYNIPGQQQRFAGERGLRDAENRAAKVIAENIRSRLASYFVGGDVNSVAPDAEQRAATHRRAAGRFQTR